MGIARAVAGFWAFIETRELAGRWVASWSLHRNEPEPQWSGSQSRISGATAPFSIEDEAIAQAEVDALRTARTLTGTELG